jgi:hypothetical protein
VNYFVVLPFAPRERPQAHERISFLDRAASKRTAQNAEGGWQSLKLEIQM